MKKIRKKQLWCSLLLSVIIAIGLIIHGVFFDLDFTQIQRFSIGGFIVTFILVFIFLLVIEKLFNLKTEEEIQEIKKEVRKLEKTGIKKK